MLQQSMHLYIYLNPSYVIIIATVQLNIAFVLLFQPQNCISDLFTDLFLLADIWAQL